MRITSGRTRAHTHTYTYTHTHTQVELQAVSRYACESMGSEWLKIFEGPVESRACTINSLRPGCTYRARVRCANQAG